MIIACIELFFITVILLNTHKLSGGVLNASCALEDSYGYTHWPTSSRIEYLVLALREETAAQAVVGSIV